MKRFVCLVIFVTGALAWFPGFATATPEQLITNGNFETGTLAGWSATTTLATPLCAWQINNCLGDPPASDGGTSYASNGFDGSGPGTYTLSQVVDMPAGTATLSWEDDFFTDYSGLPRTMTVEVLNASGSSVLGAVYSDTPPNNGDTGWVSHSVDLSAYTGQAVEIAFIETIPQDFTGPAGFGIDNIELLATPTPAPAAAVGNSEHVGYCSAAGDIDADTGQPIQPGTFLVLDGGQPAVDPSYTGATPAVYLQGLGIACGVPAGYAATSQTVGYGGPGDPGIYPYYTG